jgi:hypothetical protein
MEPRTAICLPTDQSSYCRYSANKEQSARPRPSFPSSRAFDTAALRVSKNKRAKGCGRVAVPALSHHLPLACRCLR